MAGRVVLLSRAARHAASEMDELQRAGFEFIDRTELGDTASEAQLIAALEGAWAVVAGGERYSRRVIESLPDLRAIARTGIGFDAVDVDAATDSGVAVIVTPGANSESVADFALALILACLRHTIEANEAVKSGAWRTASPGRDLFGATVGIVGLGRIGQALARRLRGFECAILGVESNPDLGALRTLGVELTDLNSMLPCVDVLSLHVPLTAETHHLIGPEQLKLLPRQAVVVNTSRGGVIDSSALADALAAGTVAAAGLDVFESEPLPSDDRLIGLANVVLAGHISSFTYGAMSRMMAAACTSLSQLTDGRVPTGCVNPSALNAGSRAAGRTSKSD